MRKPYGKPWGFLFWRRKMRKIFEYEGKFGIENNDSIEYEAIFDKAEAEAILKAHDSGIATYNDVMDFLKKGDER
jgi:hypothetical protein